MINEDGGVERVVVSVLTPRGEEKLKAPKSVQGQMEETKIYIHDDEEIGSSQHHGEFRLSYPHVLEVEEVLAQLVSTEQGLSQNEAFDRQGRLGRNILREQE